MKRNLSFLGTFICTCIFLNVQAQYSLGTGVAFGSESETVGMQFRGAYDVDAPVRIGVDVIYYFRSPGILTSKSITEFNVNGHWQFINQTSHSVYALTGFNLTRPRTTYLSTSLSSSSNHFGWNIGAGSQYEVAPQLAVVGELKYILSDADQWVLSLGDVYVL